MKLQNLPSTNLRRAYRAKDEAAHINGYRNAIFLPARYKGMWKNNLREGMGTLTTKSGVIYEGNWKNDKKHGYGLLKRRLKSQRVQYAPLYDGEWKFNERHGDGIAYYENGYYDGHWKDNCRDGLGIMSFDDGSYYIGEWKNDLYHGIGAHNDVNAGTLYKGYFRNGKRCGEGTLNFLLKRRIQKGVWVDGACVTSILQDDDVGRENYVVPIQKSIPEIGLMDTLGVIQESLQNLIMTKKSIKSKGRPTVNFECV